MFYSARGQQEQILAVWKTAFSLSLTRWIVAVTAGRKTPSLIIYRLHDPTCRMTAGKGKYECIYVYVMAATIIHTALIFNNWNPL